MSLNFDDHNEIEFHQGGINVPCIKYRVVLGTVVEVFETIFEAPS